MPATATEHRWRPLYSASTSRAPRPLPRQPHARVVSVIALVVGDLMAYAASGALVVHIRETYIGGTPLSVGLLWHATVMWIVLRFYASLYPGYGLAPADELRRSTTITVLAAVGHAAMLFALKEVAASRFIALGTWLVLIPMSWWVRAAVKSLLIRLQLFGRPIVVVGGGDAATFVVRELNANPSLGFVPVAVFDDTPHTTQDLDGVPILGPIGAATSQVFPYTVRHAVLALPEAGGRQLVDMSRFLGRRYPHLRIVPDLFGLGNLWVKALPLGTCVTLEVQNYRCNTLNLRLKRQFDILVGVPLFIASLPVIALATLLVKMVSAGPAFFAQEREGLGGRRVRIWKIRTMVDGAESRLTEQLDADAAARAHWQEHMRLQHDPRVIPHVGAFLRRFCIDELPQLWNVVKGEMSLVGPRPFVEPDLRLLANDFRDLRGQVPPGISGLWQTTVRSSGTVATLEALDSYYIHNWSPWLDLWILLRTARVVLAGRERY